MSQSVTYLLDHLPDEKELDIIATKAQEDLFWECVHETSNVDIILDSINLQFLPSCVNWNQKVKLTYHFQIYFVQEFEPIPKLEGLI